MSLGRWMDPHREAWDTTRRLHVNIIEETRRLFFNHQLFGHRGNLVPTATSIDLSYLGVVDKEAHAPRLHVEVHPELVQFVVFGPKQLQKVLGSSVGAAPEFRLTAVELYLHAVQKCSQTRERVDPDGSNKSYINVCISFS